MSKPIPACEHLLNFFSAVIEYIYQLIQLLNDFGKLSSNYGSLVAALIVALTLFFFKEFVKPPPKLSGVFYIKSVTTDSAKNSYRDMVLYHTFILYSDGSSIDGTSEKTAESAIKEGDWIYPAQKRLRGKISGKIERRYLRPHEIHLHIVENGSKRESSHYINLRYKKKGLFQGQFFSSAADSKGTIICKTTPFEEYPKMSSPSRYA
ncbi:TPA: hypothetical protein ACG0DR_001289 [Enterobacter asburiae]